MARVLRRRLPRFGILTLFAAMLLFVSATGWFKFRYDLHREEQAVLAALAKENCQVRFWRAGDEEAEAADASGAAGSLAFHRPIERLSILYLRPETRPIVDRAARLPHLRELRAQPLSASYSEPPPSVTELVGSKIDVPAVPEVSLPDLDDPMPGGEPMPRDEAEAFLRTWRDAWSQPRKMPDSYVARRVEQDGYPRDAIEIVGAGGRLRAQDDAMILSDGRHLSEFFLYPHGLVECSRRIDDDGADVALTVEPASTARLRLEKALEKLEASALLTDLLSNEDVDAIDAVRPAGRGFVRIDFAPRRFVRGDVENESPGAIADEIRLAILLRSEAEHPVEAFDLDVVRDSAKGRSTTRFALRGTSSLHGGQYRLDGVSYSLPRMGAESRIPGVPSLTERSGASRFAYDFGASIPPEWFDGATYQAIEFAEPRPLPAWRWYRATFAASAALFAFVAAKRIAAAFRGPPEAERIEPEIESRQRATAEAATEL